METILRMVERKYGKARRLWVMDRGVVSEANLAAIRKRGGQYLVGTPRSQMKRFESALVQENWTQVREDVEIKQIAIPQGEEIYLLCRTAGRKEKEKAIRERFSARMENALRGLEKSIAQGRLKDRYKMERRLGRIQERYPQVNDLYQVTLENTAAGPRLVWEIKAERKQWRDLREGAYLLRTNVQAESAEELWSKYMQLTEAEASFRVLKSELQIRPHVSSEGTTGESSCDGGISRLCPLGHTETLAPASASHRSPALRQRSEQCAAVVAHEGIGSALQIAERRYRPPYNRWARDSAPPGCRAHVGTKIPSLPAWSKFAGTSEVLFEM